MKKLIVVLSLVTMLGIISACGQEDLQAMDVFEKSIAAMNDVTDMSVTMDIQSQFEGDGEPIETVTQVTADVVLDPLAMYQKMTMQQGSDNQTFEMEMYLSEEGIFLFDPEAQQWMKFPEQMKQQLLQMSQVSTDPSAQLEQLRDFVDDFSFTEETDAYILTLTSSDDKFKDLIKQQLGNGALGAAEMAEVLENMELKQINYKIAIDKETFHQKNLEMNMEVSISSPYGDTTNMTQQLTVTMHNFNNVGEITIPEEVIENAVDIGGN